MAALALKIVSPQLVTDGLLSGFLLPEMTRRLAVAEAG